MIETATELMEYGFVYPAVGLFRVLILVDIVCNKFKVRYYKLFGIKYIMLHDKFIGKYAVRVNNERTN